MTEPVRLSKRVADMVPCSRREAEQYIEGGWVRVDGQVVETPQFRVGTQTVVIDPKASLAPLLPVTLLLHKPAGFEADLKQFKVNEYDLRKREPDLNLFVETTRWFGMKVRVEFNNILDMNKERIRTFYTGQRGLSPVLRRQLQDRTDGREVGLSLSGSF